MSSYIDPVGDTFGFEEIRLDLSSIGGSIRNQSLVLTANFATLISPASFFSSDSVVGFIDLDLDQDSTTGLPSLQSIFAPIEQRGGSFGSEIVIDLFRESQNFGFVDIFDTFFDFFLGQAPIYYGPDSFQIEIPLEILGDDGNLNFSAIVGTFSEPTDAAPDTEPGVVNAIASAETESNDTLSTAIDTGLTSSAPGLYILAAEIGNNPDFDPGLDVDIYRLELKAGDILIADIDAESYGSFLNSVLQVFDEFGNVVAFNDDGFSENEVFNFDSYLEFTAIADGSYFVAVSDYFNTFYDPFAAGSGSFGNTGNYTLNLTLISPNLITGTGDDDILTGTDELDIIHGLAGDDVIFGLAGNDTLYGDAGDDVLDGGAGRDNLYGGTGDDTIFGGDGNDFIDGGSGKDRLFGDAGDDQILGGRGNDVIYGGDGSDFIDGGDGKDRLFGDAGDDQILGGRGNDVIYGGDGNDTLMGGVGNDYLFGDGGDDVLDGGSGNDVLKGGLGNDRLNGGAGNDILIGVDQSTGFGQFEFDMLTGGQGSDTVISHRNKMGLLRTRQKSLE